MCTKIFHVLVQSKIKYTSEVYTTQIYFNLYLLIASKYSTTLQASEVFGTTHTTNKNEAISTPPSEEAETTHPVSRNEELFTSRMQATSHGIAETLETTNPPTVQGTAI